MSGYEFIEREAVVNALKAEAKYQAGLAERVGPGGTLHVIHTQLHTAFGRIATKLGRSFADGDEEYPAWLDI